MVAVVDLLSLYLCPYHLCHRLRLTPFAQHLKPRPMMMLMVFLLVKTIVLV